MIKIKKKIFFVIKSAFAVLALLILILFFYSAFFYEPDPANKTTVKNEPTQEEKIRLEEEQIRLEEEKLRLQEEELQKKIAESSKEEEKIKKINTTIKDGLFITIGDRAVTKSDIVNEIKITLILNGMSYEEDKRDDLQQMAVKSVIKQNIKAIEISRNGFLEFNQEDLNFELNRISSAINMDIDTLKNICNSNDIDFSIIENQIKTELLWNSLIFYLYKDRISINLEEIDEQLKLSQNKTVFEEFLISEIIINSVEKDKLDSKIKEIKNEIEIEGFENVAMNKSISNTAIKGGDLGWVNESEISKRFKKIISTTPVGNLSEAILLKEGILIFKVRDKRSIEKKVDLEELKKRLVKNEKSKILNMYSMSHYDSIRRSVSIKYFNE